jgi:uncharacterized protein (TIRG00374 family)
LEKLVRKRVENFVKIGIGIGLLIFLIYYIDPQKIQETFLKANKVFLLVAFLLLPLNLYLQYYKWKVLSVNYFGVKKSSEIWLSLFYGISGGIFTPMKSGEYFARALPYKKTKVLDVVLATLVDKLIPILFVVLLGGTFFILFLKIQLNLSVSLTFLLIVLFKIAILGTLYLLFLSDRKTLRIINWLKGKKQFKKIFERISFIKELEPKIIGKHIFASFLYHLTFTIQMTFLLSAFSGEFNFLLFFFAANLIIFAQIVIPPIAFGEVGVREGAAVYFLKSLGFSGAIGFNAAISLFFINLLLPSIIGFLLLLKRN